MDYSTLAIYLHHIFKIALRGQTLQSEALRCGSSYNHYIRWGYLWKPNLNNSASPQLMTDTLLAYQHRKASTLRHKTLFWEIFFCRSLLQYNLGVPEEEYNWIMKYSWILQLARMSMRYLPINSSGVQLQESHLTQNISFKYSWINFYEMRLPLFQKNKIKQKKTLGSTRAKKTPQTNLTLQKAINWRHQKPC